MCDNKNELQKSDNSKSKDNTSTRFELDITTETDTYPEYDFLELLRNLQVGIKKEKTKNKPVNEGTEEKSSPFSEDDSDVEELARLYEEKYGTCNDYAELGEGYDEEDSFIDNTDAVNDLVPNGIRTEHGGFYINRGKLTFVKEDNSSSSASEDADKFLAQNRLVSKQNTRRIVSDDENDEKDKDKVQSNNVNNNSSINNNVLNNNNNNNYNNISNLSNNNKNGDDNADGADHMYNNHNSNVNTNHLNESNTSGIIKSRKRSGEYQHKSKKIRKTATPRIPDHLLQRKPFSGSSEFRKNISEIKKNRLKNVETDKKSNEAQVNVVNNCKEVSVKKKINTVKELLKERDAASEVIEAVATGADIAAKESSSSSESVDSSSSESESDSSEDTATEKERIHRQVSAEDGLDPSKKQLVVTANGTDLEEYTAKNFAHLNDSLKEFITKIVQISKEEKNKFWNTKVNSLLLSIDVRLRDLPVADKNSIMDYLAIVLQMKKESITKRTKKVLLVQEEDKMSLPMRKFSTLKPICRKTFPCEKDTRRSTLRNDNRLKRAVTDMMPLLESNYFKEFTKAAGTSPQIYAELSRYYWSIDPGSLPQRKFPWNEELRNCLREIIQIRKNCYYIIRPRKDSLNDYVRNFLETKVKGFWPKDWMTVDILMEESQVTASGELLGEKQKAVSKIFGPHNAPVPVPGPAAATVSASPSASASCPVSRKSPISVSSSVTIVTINPPNRKPPSITTCLSPTSVSSAPPSSSVSPNRKLAPTITATKNTEVKSILIPRKTPHGGNSGNIMNQTNFAGQPTTPDAHSNLHVKIRPQVSLNRTTVQKYLDRSTVPRTSPVRHSQISPNRVNKNLSPNSVIQNANRMSVGRTSSPSGSASGSGSTSTGSVNKGYRNNTQSILKTIEIHSNPVQVSKNTSNVVTPTPAAESLLKNITPSTEVLNLTKDSSVYISKVTNDSEAKPNRSTSPSVNLMLPNGIIISPTNAAVSNFLNKQKTSPEMKLNVSLTKQEPIKEKRETVLNMNMNVKREGPLQNIPDCISVTSKVVANEKHKYEHVRKRALHEYHRQNSPERLKAEEKKMKQEENSIGQIQVKEEKVEDKNISKIFDSVIAKTSETIRQSENTNCAKKIAEKYSSLGYDSLINIGSLKSAPVGHNQSKVNAVKLRDMRVPKVSPAKEDGFGEDKLEKREETDWNDRKEQLVQMEMDRVTQNLIQLSSQSSPTEFEVDQPHVGFSPIHSSHPTPPRSKTSPFPEAFQKLMFK